MGFKKFKADQLFDGNKFLDKETVLVTDEEGVIHDLVPKVEAGDDMIEIKGIISPGFINCHCHLELSHMKGMIPVSTGLVQFVVDVVQQRHLPGSDPADLEGLILSAMEKAEDEMLKNGIVGVGDICNNALSIHQKTKGRIYYHNFIEASGFDPSIALTRFQRSLEYYKAYAQFYSIPIDSNSIVPHAPYSVSEELWKFILHFPGNRIMTIHNQETAGENEWFMNKSGEMRSLYEKMNLDTSFFKPSGKSSLQTYVTKFLPNQSLILVHNVYTSSEDLLFCQSPVVHCQLFWCLCPNANVYITGQLPDVNMLVKNNCAIVLGTDSLASNHSLSILDEMRTLRSHFPTISTGILLHWATLNGARALQMDSLLGSFEKGKKPGVVNTDHELSFVKRLI
ncbi:MAG TPA: amidohydrolase family protein [Chitinophagaceae bacterium]|nr:amidohydrolase family protein [Chitinophagaceae bacterium]